MVGGGKKRGNSHKANGFSRATLCADCENRVTNFARLFLPVTILLAILNKTHVSTRHKAIFKGNASKLTRDTLNRYKLADVIAAEAHSVSN